ncbi:NAD(P)-dependent oxidoreductase [Chloroflexi bacterium TSY]|nr:NAD(P)-dependent oxidoreductase [Chloroflexi bacterium TSY]
MNSQKKVLVTGATGQIGYMIFKRLLEQPDRYDAYALDCKREPSSRVPSSWTLEIPDDKFHLCTLTDFAGIRRAVSNIDVVVHLAADPSGESWDSLLNNNIIGTYHVFEACKEVGVSRIVAASSIMVSQGHREQEPYRAMMERRHDDIPADVLPITPDIPAEPRGLYGATKVWTESLARAYAHRHTLSCLCVRIGQVERDRPRPPQGADIYVSQRDIVQIFERCINADESLMFDIFYGMSNNDLRWVDMDHARKTIGYIPLDRAEERHNYD